MKRLTKKEELEILNECLEKGNYEKLIQQYWKLVYSTIKKTFDRLSVPYSENDIEGIRTEVFLDLMEKILKKYDPDKSSLSGFIILITTRKTLNYIRDVISKRGGDDKKGTQGSYTEENRLEARRKLKLILDNVNNLPPRDLIVYKLYFEDNLSRLQISEDLNIAIGAVDASVSRIRQYFKELFLE